MHIAIVAGETSGDALGAGLIRALRQYYPDARFSGIGGDRMCAEGFETLFPMERLSVIGIIEPLKRLPELLHIRKAVKKHCLEQQVDVFIGIDAPDFTLNIERYLRQRGIKAVHYVAPTVWAWRQGRIKGIKRSVDLMLTIFPFEAAFYQEHQVRVRFVGHPMADKVAMDIDTAAAKRKLDIDPERHVVTLMPGSRSSEIILMGELFLQVAERMQARDPNCFFLLPAASDARYRQIREMLASFRGLDIRLLQGQSQQALAAADAVLLSSGTGTLETMLYKKPMVVVYKLSPLSYCILSRLIKVPYIALPNLLADQPLVPECIQDDANVENLLATLDNTLNDSRLRAQQKNEFSRLHESLRGGGSETAARAIHELLCET